MRRFRIEGAWRHFVMRTRHSQSTKLLCTNTNNTNKVAAEGEATTSIRDLDAYRQLEKLDFMTAAKILFTTPPKNKKFGLDFHLHEVEVKKKQEEEEKGKEMEAKALEEAEKAKSDPELLQVKVRLKALEEAIKEIVVESKKQSTTGSTTKDSKGDTTDPSKSQDISSAVSSKEHAVSRSASTGDKKNGG